MRNFICLVGFLMSISVNAQTTAFSETFESANSLTLVNGTQTNKWFRGSANQCNGVSALYISNNSSSYAYTNTSASIVHAYFDVVIPSGATNIQLSFNRKVVGETTCSTCDYLQIWSVINSFVPTAGTLITANANRVLQGTISNSSICATTSYTLPNSIAGTTRRIAFTWRNDASAGTIPALIDNITVTYTPPPNPPSNDACSGATSLPCATSNLAGTTVGSVSETPPGSVSTSSFGVWYTFVGDGQQTTITSTAAFDHEMSIFSGSSCGSFTLIASVDANLANTAESHTFTTVNGQTYYVWIAHYLSGNTTTGTFTISRTCQPAPTPPINDTCSNATSLACATSGLAGTTVNSNPETVPTGISTSQYGVWYTFSGNGQQTTISSTAVFDHEMALYYGTGCGALSLITSVDNQLSNTAEDITLVTVSGVTYWVWIAHYLSGSTTTGTFTISRTCTTIADGPCTNTFSSITEAMPTQSIPTVTSTCPTNGAFPDEYMTWTGAVSGTPYIVTSSRSADWITVRKTTSNGTVEASGTSPLSWTSSVSGTIYIHINSNGACATIDNFGCRNVTVERISALPIELLYLTATPYPTFNKIEWATATEWNSDYFEIQESLDGITWNVCGIKDAAGNSNQEIKYSILDGIQEFGIHYYRLKQIDYNGEFKIYGPVAVNNPSLIKKPVKYFNVMGQEINLDNYSGVYIILYEDGSTQKMIK